jgi:ribosomal-protein-alanine N-acetyltransferase
VIVRTERLALDRPSPEDAEALFPIFTDPAGWWYEPTGRHTDIERTRGFLTRAAAKWERDGLSYWTVRRSDTAEVIGLGGIQRRASGTWNLSYRLAVSAWGHGYATELGRAGLSAAHDVDDTVSVGAWILDTNTASINVAQRLGLTDYGLQVDDNDGVIRLLFADRYPTELRG